MEFGADMFKLSPFGIVLKLLKSIAALFIKKLHSRIVKRDGFCEVRSGIVLRRRIYIRPSSVKCVCIEQGPVNTLFKMFTLFVTIKGENALSDIKVLVLPLCTIDEVYAVANECFGGFLSQKGVICFKGERFFKKRSVFCHNRDIGSLKLSRWRNGEAYTLKVTLRSKHKNTVKVRGLKNEQGKMFYYSFLNNCH